MYIYISFPFHNKRMQSPQSLRDAPCSVVDTQNLLVPERTHQPQSNETGESYKQQTVTFHDAGEQSVNNFLGDMDSTRSDSMIQDVPLDKFFERPIPIHTFDWSTSTSPTFDFDINPWVLFFSDPRNAARVNNFRLMQANLHIKIVLNGNAFFYGNAIASYNPIFDSDDYGKRLRYGVEADLIRLSQRPHIYLEPTTSQGGEMSLPFYWHKNAIDMYETDITSLGSLRLTTINPLKHANGADDKISITVFAWATDVKLAVPATEDNYILNPFLYEKKSVVHGNRSDLALRVHTPQSDEYGTGPISKPAGAIATIAGKLRDTPWIAPYALATQLGASAVSKIASVFGYSRPPQIETMTMRAVSKGTMANSNMQDDVHKLSLDIKQELTIDSRVDGRNGEDELDIKSIATKESYWCQFAWPVGATQGTMLWNGGVHPGCVRRNVGSGADRELQLGACAFAALPFTYWRGCMKYRFQVVCSKYHRGRIRVVYDPFETSASLRYNTSYTTVVDISDKTDFTIEVGWGQAQSWLPAYEFAFSEDSCQGPNGLYWNPEWNGTISVHVLNELTVPDSTIDNNITINVFASAGDDFEVAAPTSQWMSRLRFKSPGDVVDNAIATPKIHEPQSDEINPSTDGAHDQPHVETTTVVADKTDPADHMKLVHFGEPFKSFRPLLKRYMHHETVRLPNTGDMSTHRTFFNIQRQNMPFDPGYTNYPNNTTDSVLVPALVGTKSYVFADMTHLKYVTSAFAGWKGGIRYVYDASSFPCCTGNSVRAVRYSSCGPENQVTSTSNPGTVANFNKSMNLFEGGIVQNVDTNPVLSLELPYYSPYRFTHARTESDFSVNPVFDAMPCHKVLYSGSWGSLRTVDNYVAAAEDFTASFYVSTPIFYLEDSVPT